MNIDNSVIVYASFALNAYFLLRRLFMLVLFPKKVNDAKRREWVGEMCIRANRGDEKAVAFLKAIRNNPDDPLYYWIGVRKEKIGTGDDGEVLEKTIHHLTEESLYDSQRMPLRNEIKGST